MAAAGIKRKPGGYQLRADGRAIPVRDCEHCGHPFDHEALGPHGCPNCHGEGLGKRRRSADEGRIRAEIKRERKARQNSAPLTAAVDPATFDVSGAYFAGDHRLAEQDVAEAIEQ